MESRPFFLNRLLKARPEGLVEGVRILLAHPDAVTSVMTRYGYTDPDTIGGFLDRDLPAGRGQNANLGTHRLEGLASSRHDSTSP